jgi:CBS domain-containing protein
MPLKSALVKDHMSGKLVTFNPQTDVLDAIHELVLHRIAGAPVVDNHGNLVGMLSELDCMMVALTAGYHGEHGGPVSEYMTEETETGFRRYPVVKDNRLIGQISRRDVLRALGKIASNDN